MFWDILVTKENYHASNYLFLVRLILPNPVLRNNPHLDKNLCNGTRITQPQQYFINAYTDMIKATQRPTNILPIPFAFLPPKSILLKLQVKDAALAPEAIISASQPGEFQRQETIAK